MGAKYRLTTLGCKVNQYETEQVRELLESYGMRPAAKGEDADLAIVNTCAVTCSATARSRQALRRSSKKGATPTIAIGCYASAEPDTIRQIPGVTHVLGHESETLSAIRQAVVDRFGESAVVTNDRPRPVHPAKSQADVELAAETLVPVGLRLQSRFEQAPPTSTETRRSQPAICLSTSKYSISSELPIVNPEAQFSASIREFSTRTRAFLKIQDGCDASCTYCIIPKLRSRLSWKPIEVAVREAEGLVAAGHREIVLTGIFLGAYGRETAIRKRFKPGPSPLAALVSALAKVEGLARLRLSSLEPGDLDDELLGVIACHSNCVPHFHLPLQHASDAILRRMNRQYTAGAFVDMIDRVNKALDRPAISTDIIVGFPGETDELFEETMNMARYAKFCKIHAFPFSPRPGTAAARWPKDFVHQGTIKERMNALSTLEQQLAQEYTRQFVGETLRVIVESAKGLDGNPTSKETQIATGRCDRYFEIHFEAGKSKPGDVVQVQIDRVSERRVHGTTVAALT
jgi:threonylcarbamoyladenosine tRNA methylthiotransferase MtaB